MVQGQIFLKAGGGDWHLCYLILSGLSFLHSEIILLSAKLFYTFEENLFFSANIILLKKVILSCLKMNLCVCVRKVGVSD